MRKILASIALIVLVASLAWAQQICPINSKSTAPKGLASYDQLAILPVLEDGRVKPLDTYARHLLLQFSGRRQFEKRPAIEWLIRVLFAPQHTLEDKIFLVNNPDIAVALDIEPEKKRRYSFSQLQPHFERLRELAEAAEKIEKRDRDVVEAEIIRLYHNVRLYAELTLTFSFAFPHPDFEIGYPALAKELQISNPGQVSFVDIARRAAQLQELMVPLANKPAAQWSLLEQALVRLASNLFSWSQLYSNLPVHLIPSYDVQDHHWYSPWDAIGSGFHLPEGSAEVTDLQNMVIAYWMGDQIQFDMKAKLLYASVEKRMQQHHEGQGRRLHLELLYNRLDLLSWARICYVLILICYALWLVLQRNALHKFALILLAAGFILHAAALAMRITILQRPPVSNLYETFLFVGFIGALCGLLIERINKEWIGLLISALSGSVFLTIAGKFSMEGDTLQMLVAVLNSNFWLGTHVLSITTGYAGVCVAGIIGHMYILRAILQPKEKAKLEAIYRLLIGFLGFGLIMTFLGTNLGGIWADQSWGRFWGWDPKENGALLIILWTAILFHAKVGKMIGPMGLATGSCLGIMVVMWAWFGVNLLSIGLHSYGFTAGLAMNLTIYVVLQLAFLATAVPIAKRQLRKQNV